MTEPYSAGSPTVLAWFDPDTCSWRMSQQSLLGEAELLERLPNWGMTVLGELLERPTPMLLTSVRDGSASLPTPREALSRARVKARQDWHGNLEEVLAVLLPTPTARDYKDTGPNTNYEKIAAKKRLAGTIALLPTPNAGLFNDSEDPASWQERRDRQNNYAGTPLPIAVKTLPTPRAQNGETRNMNVWERPLDQPQNLENALARLNGETTDQPLNDGNELLDE